MKYIIMFLVVMFSVLFGGLGFYIGRILGAIIEFSFSLKADFLQYVFAVPCSLFFAFFGGMAVIVYIEATDFVSQKFGEFLVKATSKDSQ